MAEQTAEAARFITPALSDQTINIPDAQIWVVTYQPGDKARAHTHHETHIVCIRSGRMRWTVAGQGQDLSAGDVVVTPAGVEHSFEAIGDEPAQTACIIVPPPASSG